MEEPRRDVVKGCPLCDQIAVALRGEHLRFVLATKHFVVMVGEHQFFPGYCVVIAKKHVREIFELSPEEAGEMSGLLSGLGAAVAQEWHAHKINYASLGNVVEHLHWHVIPRQKGEPSLSKHPWFDEKRFVEFETTNEKAKEVVSRLTTPLRLKLGSL